jgi:hypothetical protein
MFVASLIGMGEWSSKKCALTWKLVGTKYNRYYCQLVPLVHHIEEIESGLLPTPVAMDYMINQRELINGKIPSSNSGTAPLKDWASNGLLPTPMAHSRQTSKEQTANLDFGVVQIQDSCVKNAKKEKIMNAGLLPTPMAQSRQTSKEQTEQRQIKYGGKTRAMYLENFAAMGWLPTPVVSDMNAGRRGNAPRDGHNPMTNSLKDSVNFIEQTSTCSHLNPQFVAEMMGFPTNWTELPFLIGEKNPSKDMEMP